MRSSADRRKDIRYPAWIPATLTWAATPEGQSALVRELSLSGASIDTNTAVPEDGFHLTLEWNGSVCSFPCQGTQGDILGGICLGAAFGPLSDEQARFLAVVVDDLRLQFENVQRFLVRRALQPQRGGSSRPPADADGEHSPEGRLRPAAGVRQPGSVGAD